ncbi:hypothetical protein [Streptomyces sp. NPDC097981]|uniref:hypothetical protein n=1 Tax=Streptomyces sp. NPDC097981 TaxID=3155428 RepID=UPI003333E15C
MLPYVYQVTKYDPADRDQHGHYAGTEDTTSDHGPVEAACLQAVAAFAEDTGVRRASPPAAEEPPREAALTHQPSGPPPRTFRPFREIFWSGRIRFAVRPYTPAHAPGEPSAVVHESAYQDTKQRRAERQ